MDAVSGVQVAAVCFIGVGMLVSGVVDLTEERADPDLGEGEVEVTDWTLPDTVTLQEGRYGNEGYYLQVPAATLAFERVTGQPVLGYKISIPELGYTRQTVYFLEPTEDERRSVEIETDTLEPERIDQSSYDATLQVVVQANGTEQVLAERPVTVEVAE